MAFYLPGIVLYGSVTALGVSDENELRSKGSHSIVNVPFISPKSYNISWRAHNFDDWNVVELPYWRTAGSVFTLSGGGLPWLVEVPGEGVKFRKRWSRLSRPESE